VTEAPLEREAQGTWAKLRRRKVVQWGLLYATGAWGLAQGLAHLVDTYHFPESIQQVGTLALAAGLPIAVVLAWYHGDKGEQKVGGTELAVLTVLLLAAGGALWWYGSRLEDPSLVEAAVKVERTVPKDAPSVAVLPFVNMSSDPEQEYFSDGLSEEILNALAQLPGLYVPARTSSFQFEDQSGDVAAFAARLGVATVLEGSVRKAGGRVRITAQLINAANGYHLWSQTYDRELTDIFAIQSEIASAIADALQLRLTAQQKLAAEREPPTRSLDAYEAYLLGRHEMVRGQPESVAKAVEHFDMATRLDPDFAAAHAQLAVAVIKQSTIFGGMRMINTPERRQAVNRASASIERALAIAPQNAEVLAAAGLVEFWRSARSRDKFSLRYFERAHELRPADGEILTLRNRELMRLGHYDRLLEASAEGLRRDPLSLDALDFRIETLLAFGRPDEVGSLVERVSALDPVRGKRWLATLAARDGDRPAAIRHCIDAARAGDRMPRCGYDVFAQLGLREEVLARSNPAAAHLRLGEYAEAQRLAEAGYKEDPAWWEWDLVFFAWYAGDFATSWRYFGLATESDRQGTGYTGWGRRPIALIAAADSARRLGHVKEADALRDRVAEDLAAQTRAAAPREPDNRWDRVLLAAYDGDADQAAALVIAGLGSDLNWRWVEGSPVLADIREREDVRAALRGLHATLDVQRREIVEMLCSDPSPPETFRPAPETCAQYRPQH